MKRSTSCVLLKAWLFFLVTTNLFAQNEIPLGTWRAHISYNRINSVAVGAQQIFAAAQHGIMVVERSDNSITSFSRLNGLTGSEVTTLNFDQATQQLLIAYADGRFDVMKGNAIRSFDPSSNSVITGSKKINHILVHAAAAYLPSDYGVVIFDLIRSEIKETWRDLGESGETLKILGSTFLGDSIFLATENGVLAGDLDDNLLDFNKWKRFDDGDLSSAVQFVVSFNSRIYAAINGSGIYHYEGGAWSKDPFLEGASFQSLTASANHLLIAEGNNVWKLNSGGQLLPVTDAKIEAPLIVQEQSDGKLWIGDGHNGLVSDVSGSFASYLPNGPARAEAFRLRYYQNKMYLLAGGYSATRQPLEEPGNLNVFENGLWTNSSHALLDLMDIEFSNSGKSYLASFGYGIEERSEDNVKVYDESNSTLVNLNPPAKTVNISAIELSQDGLWVANYGAIQSLHRLKNDNTWQSFAFPVTASRYPLDLAVDFFGHPWMVLDPVQGGGLLYFNPDEGDYKYLTDQVNAGGLPSKSVRSIAVDRDGYVWVGTDLGVGYFDDPARSAIKPIFDNRFLLKDDKVTAIAIDGGNRKWMGTERGLWLFNATGEELIYNFTEENSPLLSNNILDIEINGSTGEVFFATDKGVVSFRSDASEGSTTFGQVKVFPNPVLSNFSGTVGITGLATDAFVKITDVSGKLIWQTQANGGTASWDVRDYNGKRATTGIYLVFAATPDGVESVVGKIAVVE